MKVNWTSASHLSIRVRSWDSNSRSHRRYTLSPNRHVASSHVDSYLCAEWIGGGKRTTYGLKTSEGETVGTQGWRTMQKLVDFAAFYFYGEVKT